MEHTTVGASLRNHRNMTVKIYGLSSGDDHTASVAAQHKLTLPNLDHKSLIFMEL